MLKKASTIPAIRYGIADPNNCETSNKLPKFTSHISPILIASKNVFPEEYPYNPLQQGSHSLVFNGILLDNIEPDTLSAANILENDPHEGIKELISQRTGAYTVTAIFKTSIIAGIDHIGTIPLYYGENSDTKAIASNKKMLWAIGIEPQPLKPGHIIKISEKETMTQPIKTLEKPKTNHETSIKALHKIIKKTSQEYSTKRPKATVAFSGGIDSNLIAYYLSQNNAEIQLIWTGIENQSEQEIALRAADHLGLPIHLEEFTIEEVEETLNTIIQSIEEPNPLMTGIAYPFYWSSEKTNRLGYTTMYSGNGADELFGGYMNYLNNYLNGGDPSDEMYNDVVNSYLNNFNRDTKVCIDKGVHLLLPFTHPKLVEYALEIPITQKLPDNKDEPRKKILRKLAKTQGIPDELANRPKKAAQYSSGVNKALRKIAKKQGMTQRKLVESRFKKVINRE
jgi:asparagine synthase (glutamine-hydrolysing)